MQSDKKKKYGFLAQSHLICHRARTVVIILSCGPAHPSLPRPCITINLGSFILIVSCLLKCQSHKEDSRNKASWENKGRGAEKRLGAAFFHPPSPQSLSLPTTKTATQQLWARIRPATFDFCLLLLICDISICVLMTYKDVKCDCVAQCSFKIQSKMS